MQFGKGTVLASCPYSRDSWVGPQLINNLAMIYAWAGDKESALKQLEASVNVPSGISYGELKLNSGLGPAPRRSALRANRRLVSAKRRRITDEVKSGTLKKRVPWSAGPI
jgi:hypothetical protein